jgi:hypothetical protein
MNKSIVYISVSSDSEATTRREQISTWPYVQAFLFIMPKTFLRVRKICDLGSTLLSNVI